MLGLLAYLPALLTAPGAVAADTKQYLYLNPATFLDRARSLWDTSQFGGYVTHQQVGYLWPMGPWFWAARALGVPVWVAQRLWIGTVIFAAALGARALARRLGLAPAPALVAAVAYGFSPYLLSYVSRTSVLLLPWAALGWVLVLTMQAVERGGWRAPALVGLVVATVGGVNATALVLVAIGPLLWMADAVWARRVTPGAAVAAGARLVACSAATSLWWIVGLVIEGRFGADVLRFSETVGAVSATSSAPEVVRGLGYWLFYGSLVDGRWNSASDVYLTNPALLLLGGALVTVGLLGLTCTRWRPRRWLVLQLLVGAVVAVGAHPPAAPSAYGRLLSGGFSRSTVVLALRSSTRAVPLVILSLSLGIGASVAAAGARWPRWARGVAAAGVAAALVNLPSLVTGGYVDRLLRRDEIPAWWRDAATALDARGTGALLELPGQEFAAYRWGTTTDPILPGLTGRPLLTRDLLPLGGDQRMNLLYALDQRFQDGTIEPSAVAPVARLLGAGDVVARLDANWERYRTPSPQRIWSTLSGAPGLGAPSTYGPAPAPAVVRPVLDPVAEHASDSPASVATFPVLDVPAGPRFVPASGSTILVGDGDGVVDAAAAGLVDGVTPLQYSADLGDDAARTAAVATAGRVIVTDTNRATARQWRGTQDVVGYTEDGLPTGFARDEADARPVPFPDVSPTDEARTLAVQRGGARVVASAYGEPNAYRPEDRAWFAADGDLRTAWLVADRGDPVGSHLRVDLAASRAVAGLHLVQRQSPANRWIDAVTVRTDRQVLRVRLDASSRTPAGQVVALDGSPTASVSVTVDATDVPDPPSFFGLDAVGFAEVGVTEVGTSEPLTLNEVVRPPTDLDAALAGADASLAVDYVLTRLRVDPTNRWRHDPEPTLQREVAVAHGERARLSVQARLDRRADDAVLAGALGLADAPTASSTETGVVGARPWAAADGATGTAWTSAMGDAIGAWWQRPLPAGATVTGLDLRVLSDRHHSVPTVLRIATSDATFADVRLPPAGDDGVTRVLLPAPLPGDHLRLSVVDAEVRTTVDRRYGESVDLPVGLAEVAITTSGAAPLAPTVLPATVDTGCRGDLATVDGRALGLRVHGRLADAVAGEALTVETCRAAEAPDGPVFTSASATHTVRSAPGTITGIDIDRVVVHTGDDPPPAAPAAPTRTATTSPGHGPTAYDVHLGAGDAGWLVLADAANDGWQATIDGRSLGRVRRWNGGAAAWPVPAGTGGVVHVRWRPQRWADLGQATSLAAVAGCAAVVAVGARRRRRDSGVAPTTAIAPPLLVAGPSAAPVDSWICTAGTVVAVAMIAAVTIHPAYALCGLAPAVWCRRPGRRSARLAGPLVVLAGSAAVVARQVVSRPVAGFGWPLATEVVHRPVLAGLLLAAVAVVVDERAGRDIVPGHDPPAVAAEHLEGGSSREGHQRHDR